MSDHGIVVAKETLERALYRVARKRYCRCEVYTCSLNETESTINMINNRLAGEMTIVRVKGKGYGRQINNIKKGKVAISYY